MNTANGQRLYRYNLLLSDEDSVFLDRLSEELHATTGSKISRSEIVRAAIAGLRELHRLAPDCPSRFPGLTAARSGEDLAMLSVVAARSATRKQP